MAELKEFDSVSVTNPTDEDFTHGFNGEPYTVKSKETRGFAKGVAFLLAKHLSTRMVTYELERAMTKKEREDRNAPIHGRIAQLAIYDTPERRIALYKILGDVDIVQQVIMSFPFKGFIGEMDDYKKFVEAQKSKSSQETA